MVYGFTDNLKFAVNKESLNKDSIISVTAFNNAETKLSKSIQGVAFNKESEYLQSSRIGTPPIYVPQFNLILDEQNVLRCRSHISNSSVIESWKQPILLSPGYHYIMLITQEHHEKVFHTGIQETLNAIHQHFWIPRDREAVKKLI